MLKMRLLRRALDVLRREGVSALVVETARYLLRPVVHLTYRFPYLLPRGMARNLKARILQPRLLKRIYSPDCKRLIVFLVPGRDEANGGIMAISSIYAETVKLKHIHGAEVIMCTIPGHPRLLRYTKFANDNYIFTFLQVLSYFRNVQSMLIHLGGRPYVDQFLTKTSSRDYSRLKRIADLHVNMTIMNIQILSSDRSIARLRQLGKLTCTTGHKRYSNAELGRRLGCPMYRISTFMSPEHYHTTPYAEKENLMIVSPDWQPEKNEILRLIAHECPEIRMEIIQNMSYKQYRELITRAKWSLTFGEGIDGYFIETIFSGGIGFAVYNDDFFTEDFRNVKTVYSGYDAMARNICRDIKFLDNEESYANYQKEQYELSCEQQYTHAEYVRALTEFYQREFPAT
jgi:hypothetical protein